MKNLLLILLCAMSLELIAQPGNAADTLDQQVLSVDEFMMLVRENHPLSHRARLIRQNAEAERMKASGNFDPKLYTDVDQKYFNDQTYFRLHDYGVQIPAWFGLSAKAGYEMNEGEYLNPQEKVPNNGLWYGDVSLTLGRGLFTDERRTALRQARLMVEAADFEVDLALNDLYRNALEQYWQWHRTYQTYLTYKEAVELARVRFRGVRESALIGEQPMIDTLEATIQWQNRQLNLQEAEAELNHARQMVETYLWMDGQVPLELQDETRPAFKEEMNQPLLTENWLQNHPLLRSYDIKIEQLEVAQRLNRERLKPQIDIRYKFLNQAAAGDDLFTEYSPHNYQWGVGASFPIFLRKERGEIQKAKVKIQENTFDLQVKLREVQNKVAAFQRELVLTQQRLQETRRMVGNNYRLLQAEITMFDNGESSLFLINQREQKYLESREKEISLEAKMQQVLAKLRATAGVLDELAQ